MEANFDPEHMLEPGDWTSYQIIIEMVHPVHIPFLIWEKEVVHLLTIWWKAIPAP